MNRIERLREQATQTEHQPTRTLFQELLSLVERLSEVDPVVHIRGRWFTVCCETEGFEDDGDFHLDDCPFLLLEQWKAEP